MPEVLDTFTAAAIKYKKRHGKAPVLVVDSANRLAEYRPELLDTLQDAAKVASDSGTFRVIFISSKGNVPARMKGWRIPLCVIHSLCLPVYSEECMVKACVDVQDWRYILGGCYSVPHLQWSWRGITRSNLRHCWWSHDTPQECCNRRECWNSS